MLTHGASQVDPQLCANLVCALDEQTAMTVVCQVLAMKVQIVPAVLAFMLPSPGEAPEVHGGAVDETQQAAFMEQMHAALEVPEFRADTLAFMEELSKAPVGAASAHDRYVGVVKNFSEDKGFGFIASPALKVTYGRDVFLHHQQLGSFKVGSEISFLVRHNKNGDPQAHELLDATGQAPPSLVSQTIAAQARSFGMDSGTDLDPHGVKRKLSEFPETGPHIGQPDVQRELGQFVGRIKNFLSAAGYGFIECPDVKAQGYRNDVFLHHQQVKTFHPGDTVVFTCYLNAKGQPQAKDLVAAPGMATVMDQVNLAKRMRLDTDGFVYTDGPQILG